MSQTCDIPIHKLTTVEKNFFRIDTLREANDIVVNSLSKLRIFQILKVIDNKLLAGVDGQKYGVQLKTIQARHSPKYFGLKPGIVAYTLQINHAAVNSQIFGPQEYEGSFVFDIVHNNTSDVDPDMVTGDMHSINGLNYALLDAINKSFIPNINDVQNEVLSTLKPLKTYENCFIKPTRLIPKALIKYEWDNIQRILASLVLREAHQSTIIKKLSSTKYASKTKRALNAYNDIFKSLHLLEFIDNKYLRSYIRRVLNRTEAYHQLRRAIAKVGSGQFKNQSIVENEVWNDCASLIANYIIYYNALILDQILDLLPKDLDAATIQEIIEYVKRISPVSWGHHINLTGKYEFSKQAITIEVEKILEQLQRLGFCIKSPIQQRG